MKNDEKNRETTMKNDEKERKTTMKHDEKEKTQWKTMKNRGGKTRKHDEK